MLSDRLITKFAEIVEQQTGERLAPDEARNAAERMVAWFELLAKYADRSQDN